VKKNRENKLAAKATTLEEFENEVRIDHSSTNIYHLMKNGENRSCIDPAIIWLQLKI